MLETGVLPPYVLQMWHFKLFLPHVELLQQLIFFTA